MGAVAEDLIPILTRFHREVVLPDVRHVVGEVVGDLEGLLLFGPAWRDEH